MSNIRNKRQLFSLLFILICIVGYYLYPTLYQIPANAIFKHVYQYNANNLYAEHSNTEESYIGDEVEVVSLSVIARPPQTPYDTLLAIQTSQKIDSVSPNVNNYVVNAKGMPIGYISAIKDDIYEITLFSSPSASETFSVGGFVTKSSGLGGGGISMTTPMLPSITEGVEIFHQPTGVSIAKVQVISEVKGEDSQDIFFTLPSNPFLLHKVYIDSDVIRVLDTITDI